MLLAFVEEPARGPAEDFGHDSELRGRGDVLAADLLVDGVGVGVAHVSGKIGVSFARICRLPGIQRLPNWMHADKVEPCSMFVKKNVPHGTRFYLVPVT